MKDCSISLSIGLILYSLFTNTHNEPLIAYSANTYFNKAEESKNRGEVAQAIDLYRKTISLKPDHFEAHFYLANELFKLGNYQEAISLYQKAAHIHENSLEAVPALYNLAFTLHVQHKNDQALPVLERVCSLCPEHTKARLLRASLYMQQESYARAQHEFEAILSMDTMNTDALIGCARAHHKQGHIDAARECLKKAAIAQPNNVSVLFELGYTNNQMGDLHDALDAYTKAITIDPHCMHARYNRAQTLRTLGRMHEARTEFELLLETNPHDAHLHYGFAESLLATGNLEKGFAEFEWRWKREADERNFAHKLWDGSSLEGKTILLRAEYGHGDTLQFIRFIPALKRQGATVVLEAQHSLVTLLSHCSYIDQVIPVGAPLPAFDVQLPLMSLAHRLHTTLETIPQIIPYITIDNTLVMQWKKQLQADTNIKIGICWDASPYYASLQHQLSKKSIPLTCFEALARIPKVSLYSLQCMNGTDQLQHLPEGMMVHTFGESFDLDHGRFMDTAAVMHELDLVICVDTSVAHLAGALGVPVWVLLPHVADWRWMQEREDTPWYPTMRLFRQHIPGDWELLMQTVAHELEQYVKNHKSAQDIITAEISVGELVDKITILEIKQEEITDTAKLRNINTELATLNKTRALFVPRTPDILRLSSELKTVNKKLWIIEDAIREKERAHMFDHEFIELARAVYFTNDLRCKIKRQINDQVGSRLVEEKSYKDYQQTASA